VGRELSEGQYYSGRLPIPTSEKSSKSVNYGVDACSIDRSDVIRNTVIKEL